MADNHPSIRQTEISTDLWKQRLEAWPVRRILDADSNEIVGYLYKWNTGELTPLWKDKPKDKVIYE